jgi:hypothetical protein
MRGDYGAKRFERFLGELEGDYELNAFLTLKVGDPEKVRKVFLKLLARTEEPFLYYLDEKKKIEVELRNKRMIETLLQSLTRENIIDCTLLELSSFDFIVHTHGKDITISNQSSDERIQEIINIWKKFRG